MRPTEGIAVDQVRDRIEQELGSVMDRLRQLGGAVLIEEFPGALEDASLPAELVEKVQVLGEREISFATRSLLVERANRLAQALERLREGEYGTCEECGKAIAPARLRAMPEVTMRVPCQDRLEREARRLPPEAPVLSARGKRTKKSIDKWRRQREAKQL